MAEQRAQERHAEAQWGWALRAFAILTWVSVALVLGAALAIGGFILVLRVLGMDVLVVASGSMEPTFGAGDALAVSPITEGTEVGVGDQVVIHGSEHAQRKAHRVIGVHEEGGRVVYETKGDANATADPERVPRPVLESRIEFSVPVLGRLLWQLRDPVRVVLILALPVLLLIANQLFRELAPQRAR